MSRCRLLALTAVGLGLIAVCYGLARFAYGLFLPAFSAEFGMSSALAGTIAAGSYLAYCVGVIAGTVATTRWGAKRTAISAGLVAAGGIAVIALAADALLLAIGVLVAGSSTGIASPPLAHAVAAAVPASRRDRVQATINAGTGVGVLVAGPVAVAAQESWRIAWWVFAGLCLAVTVAVLIAVPSARTDRAERPERTRRRPHVPVRTRSPAVAESAPRPAAATAATPLPPTPWPQLRPMLIAAAGVGLASAAPWTFGRELLSGDGGMGAGAVTLVWIMLGAFGILGAAAGDVIARIGLRWAFSSGMLTMAAATALLAATPASVPLAGLAAAAFGASYIALTGGILIWGTRIYPDRPATGVGAGFIALAAGQALGSPLIGAASDVVGLRLGFLLAVVVACAAAAIRPAE